MVFGYFHCGDYHINPPLWTKTQRKIGDQSIQGIYLKAQEQTK